MKRAAFLTAIGDPDAMKDEADRLEREALVLWYSVKDLYFTAKGQERAHPPAPGSPADRTRQEVNRLRRDARALLHRAADVRRLYADPWSHTRPDILRREGFIEQAERVEQAYARYLKEAEDA